jgi:hypothetical protein
MSEEYNEWYWRLYRWVRWELPYQHKYIKYGVKNLYKWFWVIWKDRDFDYHYTYQILKFKLEKQAKHLGKRNWHESSKRDAELMMTCVRLINKLQNEEYYDELYNLDKRSPEALKIVTDRHNKARRLLFNILDRKIESFWD